VASDLKDSPVDDGDLLVALALGQHGESDPEDARILNLPLKSVALIYLPLVFLHPKSLNNTTHRLSSSVHRHLLPSYILLLPS
jgi:hypothetical protein